MSWRWRGLGLATLLLLPAPGAALAALVPAELRCEYLANPLGIDIPHPRLSWVLKSDERGQRQAAYQVLVASTSEQLAQSEGDLWDSHRTVSELSAHIPYAGPPLQSDRRYWWAVRVWDRLGRGSRWSEPAFLDTGLLTAADWRKARWIARKPEAQWRSEGRQRKAQETDPEQGLPELAYRRLPLRELYDFYKLPIDPAPLFRREFRLPKSVRRARAYVCGLGYYELFLNGRRVGDHVLDPGWTDYTKRVLYVAYDVTEYLQAGANAVGVRLGRGWYNVPNHCTWNMDNAPWSGQPKFILRLSIESTDGRRTNIVSDTTWRTRGGPLLFDSQRGGEIYDARREQPGWTSAGYDDGAWSPAQSAPAPPGRLRAQLLPPIRAGQLIKPIRRERIAADAWTFVLPQCIAGWPRMRVRGARGTTVTLDLREYPGAPAQQLVHILRGDGAETIEGHFAYYGFQYVTVRGRITEPRLKDLVGVPVHSDVEPVGRFECSNPLLNRIHQNVRWTLLNNFHSLPTDCPTREKLGWTADAHLTAEAAIYNFDMAAFYTKWCHDMTDAQYRGGRLPTWLPNPYPNDGEPTWSGACALLPWSLYQYYGDQRILEEQYPTIRAYAQHVADQMHVKGKPDIVRGGPGDWLPPDQGNVPLAPEGHRLYGTAYYFRVVDILQRMALVLGKTGEARQYAAWAGRIKKAFNQEFFDPVKRNYYGERSPDYRQSANAVALQFGLVPNPQRPTVLAHLVQDIQNRGTHLNTGILGTKALMEVLPAAGRAEVAYALATQTTYPSWGWQIRNYGATTIAEWWNGKGSRNHPAFGSVDAYFYRHLAGIQTDPNGVGFQQIIIHPTVVADLDYVMASVRTIRGEVRSAWHRQATGMLLKVSIPVGSAARVHLPKLGLSPVAIEERGQRFWDGKQRVATVDGIGAVRDVGGDVVVRVGSGSYSFRTLPASH